MIIYKVKNKINGKCYIGQTTRNMDYRKSQHLKTAYNNLRERNYFHWALREWGKENFEWQILCNCSNKEELNKKEKFYINKYNTYNPDFGYNKSEGGQGIPERGKLKKLLSYFNNSKIYTQSYLSKLGFNHDLVKSYRRSGWIESIGSGAYKLYDDTVDWFGGLETVQKQNNIVVHVGGKTALELNGSAKYRSLKGDKCFLFANSGTLIPKWFKAYNWNVEIVFKSTNLFPPDLKESFLDYLHKEISIKISAPERAALEMLYYVPSLQGFDEALHIMESLITLRPGLIQKLLEQCNSVKVKRLFLYLAEKLELPWFEHINSEKINLGSGKRVIVSGGVFDKKYLITVNK